VSILNKDITNTTVHKDGIAVDSLIAYEITCNR